MRFNYLKNGIISIIFFSYCSWCYAAAPAIHLLDGEWGAFATNRSTNPYMGFEVNVTDTDGISSDGSSHTVTVLFPDNVTLRTLNYDYRKNNTTAFYTLYPSDVPQEGIYLFTVSDGTQISTFVDNVVLAYPNIPNKSTFTPTNGSITDDTTPTFNWDVVPNTAYYEVRIYNNSGSVAWRAWPKSPPYTVPSGILDPDTTYRYRIEARVNHFGFEADTRSIAPAQWDEYLIFTTGTENPSPSIDLDSTGVTSYTNNYYEGTFLSFWIEVYDPQGVPDNIQSVTVTFPDGITTETLYYDYNSAQNSAFYRTMYFGAIQNGTYTFKAVDKDGNTATRTEDFQSNGISYPPRMTMTPKQNEVVNSTGVNFDWEDVPGVASYQLEIYSNNDKRIHRIFTIESDFQMPPGVLEPNQRYSYRIVSRKNFGEDNYDNGSANSTNSSYDMIQFATTKITGGTSPPTIDLDIWGVYSFLNPNPINNGKDYWLVFEVIVGDPDGMPGNIESVDVTYPDGVTKKTLNLYQRKDNDSAVFLCTDIEDNPSSFQSGTYSFTATDFDGNSITKTDDIIIDFLPVVTTFHPNQDEILDHTRPTITWDPVQGASFYRVRFYDSFFHIFYSSDFLTETSYIVPHNILDPYTIYGYAIYAYRENTAVDVDNSSKNRNLYTQLVHLTTGKQTVPGDIDGNSIVDLTDLILTLKILTETQINASVQTIADINSNRRIDSADAAYILRKIAMD